MSDFTKGPWRIVIKPTSSDNYFHLEGGCGYYDDKTDNGFFLDGFMREEDAHLIRSSPDMYEALDLIRTEFLEATTGDPYWLSDVAFDMLTEAIAKADGKS